MVVTKDIKKIRKIIKKAKEEKKIVGFIPTMGALHQGHLALVKHASKNCGYIVVSIFINPKQFAPQEDFNAYPRQIKKDLALLKNINVDLVFTPDTETMYPLNFSTYVEETQLSKPLCGKSRPNHFQGVTTVVTKLFNIVLPDIAYFGQKDFQQASIIQRIVNDLNIPVTIKIIPTVREKTGLALSSRNKYLTPQEYKNATTLYKALCLAKTQIKLGEKTPKTIIALMHNYVKTNLNSNDKIDYIEILNAETLKPLKQLEGKILIALAILIGKTRLIDNFIVNI